MFFVENVIGWRGIPLYCNTLYYVLQCITVGMKIMYVEEIHVTQAVYDARKKELMSEAKVEGFDTICSYCCAKFGVSKEQQQNIVCNELPCFSYCLSCLVVDDEC